MESRVLEVFYQFIDKILIIRSPLEFFLIHKMYNFFYVPAIINRFKSLNVAFSNTVSLFYFRLKL